MELLIILMVATAGLIDIAINVAATAALGDTPGRLVAFHARFNGGAAAGAALTGVLLGAGASWRWLWAGVAIAALVLSVVCAKVPLPAGKPGDRLPLGGTFALLRRERLLLVAGTFALAALVEGGIELWGVLFLRTYLASGILIGAGGAVLGYSVAGLARFTLGPTVGRRGSARGVMIGAGSAALGVAILATAGTAVLAAVGLVLAAGGISMCWPLLIAQAGAGDRTPARWSGPFRLSATSVWSWGPRSSDGWPMPSACAPPSGCWPPRPSPWPSSRSGRAGSVPADRCQILWGDPGATLGHPTSRSATTARSNSSCSRWCPDRTCSPTGRSSTSPQGMLTAGLPLRFDGAVRAAVFMMARANPISWMRSAPGMEDGGGPSRGEGHVGVGRAHDEVGLGEEVGHGFVELASIGLDGRRLFQRVPLPGRLDTRSHLCRQLVDAPRVGAPQISHESDLAGHGPLPAEDGEGGDDIDDLQARGAGQFARRRRPRVRPPRHGPGRSRGQG